MYAHINRSPVHAASARGHDCRSGAAASIASPVARVIPTRARRERDGESGKPI